MTAFVVAVIWELRLPSPEMSVARGLRVLVIPVTPLETVLTADVRPLRLDWIDVRVLCIDASAAASELGTVVVVVTVA